MRPDFFRIGAQALRYWERRQEVIANNLANAETTGFKAERVFAQLVGGELEAGAATDLRAGTLTPTANPLDVAIDGEGYFVVKTPNGDRLTRAGSFQVSADGLLVNAQGHSVLGERGLIDEKEGTVAIDRNGSVSIDGIVIDRLRVVTPGANTTLAHEGGTLFRADGAIVNRENARVRQGVLEDSNTDTLQSMVEMIEVQRAYSAVQGSLRTLDGVMDTIANQIGRLS